MAEPIETHEIDDAPGAFAARAFRRGLFAAAEARRADFWRVAEQAGRVADATPDEAGRAATWLFLLMLRRLGARDRAARMGAFLHEARN